MATPWSIDTAVYDEKYKSVESEESTPRGIFFKSDGLKMYVVGATADRVFQYSLAIAWSIDTAVYEDKSKDVSGQDSSPYDIFFKPDGTKMYMLGGTSDKVHQYTLSTPHDVDTAVYDNKFIYVGGQDSKPVGVEFNPDGTKMYIVGFSRNRVHQYSLSVPWDIETATYTGKYKTMDSQDLLSRGVAFNPNGTRMYLVGTAQDTVFQSSLSVPWDILTVTYAEKSKYVGDKDINPFDLIFSSDGMRMYIMGYSTKTVYQYSLPPPQTYYKSLGGSLSFLGSLSTAIPGKFLQATLSIAENGSDLSIAENKSALSIYENESILSIEE